MVKGGGLLVFQDAEPREPQLLVFNKAAPQPKRKVPPGGAKGAPGAGGARGANPEREVIAGIKAKNAPAKEPIFAPERRDGETVLGKTSKAKPVYASGGDAGKYDDDEHGEAAQLHHGAHLYHSKRAEVHEAAGKDDDNWQRGESQSQDAKRHTRLAEHHHEVMRNHLVAGGHGGKVDLDLSGDKPALGDYHPHDEKDRGEAQEFFKRRKHAKHPGGLTPADRTAYAGLKVKPKPTAKK